MHRVLEIAKLIKYCQSVRLSHRDSGFMGVSDAQNETPSVSDDDLAAELLGGVPAAPAAPATSAAPADAPSESEASSSDDDGPTIAPGSFG